MKYVSFCHLIIFSSLRVQNNGKHGVSAVCFLAWRFSVSNVGKHVAEITISHHMDLTEDFF